MCVRFAMPELTKKNCVLSHVPVLYFFLLLGCLVDPQVIPQSDLNYHSNYG
jgi:hypothetical protein